MDKNETAAAVEPAFLSIKDAAAYFAESEWQIKAALRRGDLTAQKSGRRTLINFESAKRRAASLPVAKFAPPRLRRTA